MAKPGIRFEGGDIIRKRLKLLLRNIFDAVAVELNDQADEVLQASNDEAPQLTGQMILSSDWDADDSRATGTMKRSVFYVEPYAIIQHEDFFFPGPITSQKLGGSVGIGRKFLQRPFNEFQPTSQERIGRVIMKAARLSLR